MGRNSFSCSRGIRPDEQRKFVCFFVQGAIDLRVVQVQQVVLVVGVAVEIAVLVDFNQLPLFQSFDGFSERTFLDAGIPNDFRVSRPAVSFAAGAADEVGIQLELRGIQRHLQDRSGASNSRQRQCQLSIELRRTDPANSGGTTSDPDPSAEYFRSDLCKNRAGNPNRAISCAAGMLNVSVVPAPLMVDMTTCDGASKRRTATRIFPKLCRARKQNKADPDIGGGEILHRSFYWSQKLDYFSHK